MSRFGETLTHLRSDFIGHKLIVAVGVAVFIGLLALVTFYAERQEANIKAHNERTMRNVTESVTESLQTVMLAGYADIAHVFADKLKNMAGVVDFRILRTDGNEAFRDNKTILDVNKRRGQEDFLPRDDEAVVPVLASSHRDFRRALEERRIVTFYETSSDGEEYLTFLAPVQNEDKCQKCHGKANPIRGVLKLTTSLSPVIADIQRSWLQSIVILATAITIIMAVTNHLIRRSVVSPIITMSAAMAEVSRGELSLRVPVLSGDELGQMAKSFNHMTDELSATLHGFESERNKLTTIILSADEGMVVTDPGGRVVLANPAALRLLGKSFDRLVLDGFLAILDDPQRMQDWLHRPGGVKGEIVEYGDRILSITAATIAGEDGAVMGSTALLRDVTETQRLEEKLRALSFTDGLTGLGNRRFLDQSLERELARAATHGDPLAIAMFDIDHFKRFNDTYGHDQGDRVLKAVAEVMRQTVRVVDIPCRYGGEEFLVILRNTGRDGAAVIAERLRANIEEMVVDRLKVTVSIGVAMFDEVRPAHPLAFIEFADKALYAAKEGGRNRVVIAEPTPPAETESLS